MKSRAPFFLAIGLVLLLIIVPVVFLKPSGDLPFDQKVWKSSPADSEWTYESVRYRMRNGAIEEVRRARTPADVEAILGVCPMNSMGPSANPKSGGTSFAYRYLLGWNRKSKFFGDKTGETYLDVRLDTGTHTTEAKLTTLDSGINP